MNKKNSVNVPFPRPGSAEYGLLLETDEKKKKKILTKWKRMNKLFIIPLYRIGLLPIFGINKIFLLLYTKGRKTGKTRITPVEYRRKDGYVHVVAARGKKAHWFKNMIAHPEEVMVKIGFKKRKTSFEIFESIDKKNNLFKWYVEKYPKAAKYLFGWDPKIDVLETADFTSFSELIEIIKFDL